jgi:tetratricopeptide (TPR) repeat protein
MAKQRQQSGAPAIPVEAVHSHLEAVLKSPIFVGSERLCKFLRFLVEKTLKGEADQLKEYAGLADSYQNVNVASAPLDLLVKAKAAATKAVELDDTLAEAHTSLARVKLRIDLDWPGAERELKRALDLNPNDPAIHQQYSIYFSALERHENARFEAQRARQLDPLSLFANQNVGFPFYAEGRYDEALNEFRKTLEMDPSFLLAQRFLGYTYVRKRMYPEAIVEFRRARELGDNYMSIFGIGLAQAASGNRSEALQRISDLHELSKHTYVSPLPTAVIYAALGEKDQAFEWLEKAYQERSVEIILIKAHGFFDNLRSDPRYKDSLRRVGLPP